MKYEFNYSKLSGKIREKFRTQKAFVAKISMSEVSFSKKINNKLYFSQDEIEEIFQVLELDLSDIPSYFYCLKS